MVAEAESVASISDTLLRLLPPLPHHCPLVVDSLLDDRLLVVSTI